MYPEGSIIINTISYISSITISMQDLAKIYFGLLSILLSHNILQLNKKLINIIILYTSFITFFGWELWWTMAYPNAPICNNKIAYDYTTRAYICNNDPRIIITSPQCLHAVANTLSDIFLIIIIFHIGLYGVPNAFNKNISFKNICKFITIINFTGVSQNMLLDSIINFFPKYCCGINHNEWCPISWAPLSLCQFCPYQDNKLVTICLNTELTWFIVPSIIYVLSFFTYNYLLKI